MQNITIEDARELGAEAWSCGDLASSNRFDPATSPALHGAWADAWDSAAKEPGRPGRR